MNWEAALRWARRCGALSLRKHRVVGREIITGRWGYHVECPGRPCPIHHPIAPRRPHLTPNRTRA